MSNLRILAVAFPLVFTVLTGCHQGGKDLTVYVDPMTGTAGEGNTFPGAVAPFGMVQLSPDTRTGGDHSASGYYYGDSTILGFSHTHYSGTGRGSGGDFLFMPATGGIQLTPGRAGHPEEGYRSAFSHTNEHAEPGYYRVLLDDDHILAELTATRRAGIHRYTFPDGKAGHIILDLSHGIKDRPDSLVLEIVDDHTIRGMRKSLGGLRMYQTLFFTAQFSASFSDYGVRVNGKEERGMHRAAGRDLQAWFRFPAAANPVEVKVAISKVDESGAEKNLAEIAGMDFDQVRRRAHEAWRRELAKIEVQGGDAATRRIFYTAFYHASIHPSLDMDADGRYRSTNNRIYTARGFEDYTNFSLWDTWRALHPLQMILNRGRTLDFIRTFLERYEHSGHLPEFELSGNEVPSMIAYHSLPVIADAWVKGIRTGDTALMVAGMKDLANLPLERREEYKVFGYVPYDYTRQSVSRTLEYSFDDWSVAQVLRSVQDGETGRYIRRGNFYRNVFDKKSGFMRPKDSSYRWLQDFDPYAYTRYYTQANAFAYTTFVLQDIPWLIRSMGGDTAFVRWLDRFFTDSTNSRPGLIGQYYHGNEPGHHAPYLYVFAGAPWKTQMLVRKILTTQYRDAPDGLCGNDDAGQMSAWYVLSAMGFYSVTPGRAWYVIGSPLFDKVLIHLENGKTFTLEAHSNAPDHPYIRSATLNGRPWDRAWFSYTDIMNGGTLVLEMAGEPARQWAARPEERPPVEAYDEMPVTEVHVAGRQIPPSGEITFRNTCLVSLTSADKAARIHYTTDGTLPDLSSPLYRQPFTVRESCVLQARAFSDAGRLAGYTSRIAFRKLTPLPAVTLHNPLPGVRYTCREVWLCKAIEDIFRYPPQDSGVLPAILPLPPGKTLEKYGMTYDGYLKVPSTGIYTFHLVSDDGSRVTIDGIPVVSASGRYEREGRIFLEKGFHAIDVKHFQVGGKPWIRVSWEGPGFGTQEIPAAALFREKEGG